MRTLTMKFQVSSFKFQVAELLRPLMTRRGMLALALSVVLTTLLIACGAPSRETITKLHAGADVVVNVLVVNETLPEQLLAEKIIKPEQYETVKKYVSQALSGARTVRAGLAIALNEAKPSLKFLAPVVADILAQLRGLSSFVNHETVQKVFAAAEIGLRVLGSYFALQISQARDAGLSDVQICANAGLPYDRAKFNLLANTYDGRRFEEYAAAL